MKYIKIALQLIGWLVLGLAAFVLLLMSAFPFIGAAALDMDDRNTLPRPTYSGTQDKNHPAQKALRQAPYDGAQDAQAP